MKFNKNVFAFGIYLTMLSPVIAHEDTEENTTQATHLEEIVTTKQIMSDEEDNAQQVVVLREISEEQAAIMLQEFSENLAEGQKFSLDTASFVIDTTTKLSQAQENIMEEIGSDLMEAAASAIAGAINAAIATPISQHTAVVLLQEFTSNLVTGNTFTLNGVTYTVQAPK